MKIEKIKFSETAWLTAYLQENPREDKKPFPAMIIVPGGGYEYVSSREAEPIAMAFLAQGYQVIVLDYTVMSKGTQYNFLQDCLNELSRTFEEVHQNAVKWEIDTEKIFLIGFSAGAHLAAWYANTATKNKPAGLLLAYALISFDYGWPLQASYFNFPIDLTQYNTADLVNEKTPPVFIWQTGNDAVVPVYNSLKFCEQLGKFNIPFEAHIFEKGYHGLSLANRTVASTDEGINPNVARWLELAVQWLEVHLATLDEQ